MPQLEAPVHHCFQSFRVLDDKKKKKHITLFYVIKHAMTVINVVIEFHNAVILYWIHSERENNYKDDPMPFYHGSV